MGFGHEQRVIQSLAAALQQEQLQLEARQTNGGSNAASADAAVLFYRVASRLDVRDVLQQAQALQGGVLQGRVIFWSCMSCQSTHFTSACQLAAGGDKVTQMIVVLAHNVPASHIRFRR